MRRIIICTSIAILLVMSSTYGRKAGSRSAKVQDGVFTDEKNKFSVTFGNDWKAAMGKDDASSRLVLTPKNVPVKLVEKYAGSGNKADNPGRMEFWILRDAGTAASLIDSFASNSASSRLKSEILEAVQWRFYNALPQQITATQRLATKIAGKDAIQWTGRVRYVFKMMGNSSSEDVDVILLGVDCGDHVLLVVASCHPSVAGWFSKASEAVVKTLKWVE